MEIVEISDKEILRFHGGPTGFESYYLENIIGNDGESEDLYICAGTINSWPPCYVKRKDVNLFIKEYLSEEKNNQ